MCISSMFKTPKVTMPSVPAPTPTPPSIPVTSVATDLDPLATIRKKRLGKQRFKSGALGGLTTGDAAMAPSGAPVGLPSLAGIGRS